LSVYRIANNPLRTTPILGIRTESQTVKTFTFKDKACARAKPGQFLMLWIPGVDEIPLSIMKGDGNGAVAVAVKKVGEATSAVQNMQVGEVVGLRGPFGNSFSLRSGKVLLVGGGTGVASLLSLARELVSHSSRPVFVMGAKTRDELLYIDKFEQLCSRENVIAATEDGSYGVKGLATAPVDQLLRKDSFDVMYTCGPEKMMREVLALAKRHNVCLEASLERLMRCAIGVCGSCVIGGYSVCWDGPVFTKEQLEEFEAEFGVSKRDFDGRKVPI